MKLGQKLKKNRTIFILWLSRVSAEMIAPQARIKSARYSKIKTNLGNTLVRNNMDSNKRNSIMSPQIIDHLTCNQQGFKSQHY